MFGGHPTGPAHLDGQRCTAEERIKRCDRIDHGGKFRGREVLYCIISAEVCVCMIWPTQRRFPTQRHDGKFAGWNVMLLLLESHGRPDVVGIATGAVSSTGKRQ
jgi:hypothetical protein